MSLHFLHAVETLVAEGAGVPNLLQNVIDLGFVVPGRGRSWYILGRFGDVFLRISSAVYKCHKFF